MAGQISAYVIYEWSLSTGALHIDVMSEEGISYYVEGAIEISTWDAEGFYKKISNVCFESDPLSRADFSQVVSIIQSEMTEEELIRYNEMQNKHHDTFDTEKNV